MVVMVHLEMNSRSSDQVSVALQSWVALGIARNTGMVACHRMGTCIDGLRTQQKVSSDSPLIDPPPFRPQTLSAFQLCWLRDEPVEPYIPPLLTFCS